MKKNDFSEMKKKGNEYGSDTKSLSIGMGILTIIIACVVIYFCFFK